MFMIGAGKIDPCLRYVPTGLFVYSLGRIQLFINVFFKYVCYSQTKIVHPFSLVSDY